MHNEIPSNVTNITISNIANIVRSNITSNEITKIHQRTPKMSPRLALQPLASHPPPKETNSTKDTVEGSHFEPQFIPTSCYHIGLRIWLQGGEIMEHDLLFFLPNQFSLLWSSACAPAWSMHMTSKKLNYIKLAVKIHIHIHKKQIDIVKHSTKSNWKNIMNS